MQRHGGQVRCDIELDALTQWKLEHLVENLLRCGVVASPVEWSSPDASGMQHFVINWTLRIKSSRFLRGCYRKRYTTELTSSVA